MAREPIDDATVGLSPATPVQGSRIESGHTVRKMREFVIFEQELDQIGLLNTLSSATFSAASGLFLFVIGLIANAVIQGWSSLPVDAIVLLKLGVPAGVILGLILAVVGYILWRRKGSILATIKEQAVDIEQSTSPPFPRRQVGSNDDLH